MKRSPWITLPALVALACSGENFASGSGSVNLGKDGGPGGTGQSSSGGVANAGGRTGSSGSSGNRSTGGTASAGGAPTSGGVTGSGGATSSGGAGATGTGGTLGTGGILGTGGNNQSGGGSGVADAGTGGPKLCGSADATFPTFVKGCSGTANCVLVKHQTDCCGSRLVMALNHGEVTKFDASEKICESQYPLCGCVSQGIQAEDGTTVPADKESAIVAECSGQLCRSKYSGKTFACGPKTCTDLQYCSVTMGGAVGSLPTYNCVPMGTCTSCACLPNSGACSCLVAAVGNTVTCKAP